MTPQDVFDALDAYFHFVCDMAAEDASAKCDRYITKEIDTLLEDWSDWVEPGEYGFMNPPYGKRTKDYAGVEGFVEKACNEALHNGVNSVLLLHAKTDTQWWHRYCWRADEIWEVEGRIPFIDPNTNSPGKGGAPCGQAIVVFRRDRLFDCDGPRRKRVDRGMNELTDHRR